MRIGSVVELILGRGEGGPDNKVASSFQNKHFMGHGRLDSILGSYSVPRTDFSFRNQSQNTGSETEFVDD
jgi:hypothetical protein